MDRQPPSSGSSIPPPIAANATAARYAASLHESGDATEAAAASRREKRSLGETLVPLVGVYFLGMGLYKVVLLIQHLPTVTGTPQPAGTDNVGSSGWTVASSGFGVWWLIGAVLALASIYAGVRILYSDERGRSAGILLALAGIAFSLITLSATGSSVAYAWMALDALILWALMASKTLGRR